MENPRFYDANQLQMAVFNSKTVNVYHFQWVNPRNKSPFLLGKSQFLLGKSTISMAIFNSKTVKR